MSQTQALIVQREKAVLVLKNNDPTSRNAMSEAWCNELISALNLANHDDSIACVVLTGVGGNFCAGGNLKDLVHAHQRTEAQRWETLQGINSVILAIRDCSKPIIAAVEGAAAGAGVSLALACDMMVVARDAVFLLAYVNIGVSPDGGATSFLAEGISRQLLSEFCLLGERISGERMYHLGFANRLTESADVLPEAMALASQVVKGPRRSMARIKHLCHTAQTYSLNEQLDIEARYMVESLADSEAQEGIRAFLEKRKTDYLSLRKI